MPDLSAKQKQPLTKPLAGALFRLVDAPTQHLDLASVQAVLASPSTCITRLQAEALVVRGLAAYGPRERGSLKTLITTAKGIEHSKKLRFRIEPEAADTRTERITFTASIVLPVAVKLTAIVPAGKMLPLEWDDIEIDVIEIREGQSHSGRALVENNDEGTIDDVMANLNEQLVKQRKAR